MKSFVLLFKKRCNVFEQAVIEKGHEAYDTISDISSTEFYKIMSRFWCAWMRISVFLYIWNPVPNYTASRPKTQTHWHIINVFFISPYLTKCASKLILLDSVTLVPFNVTQLRPLFRGTVPFRLLHLNDDNLAYIWQLIYLTRLQKEWPAPTRLCLQDMDIRLSKLLPWGVLAHVYEVTNARRSIKKQSGLSYAFRSVVCCFFLLYVLYLTYHNTHTHSTPHTHSKL